MMKNQINIGNIFSIISALGLLCTTIKTVECNRWPWFVIIPPPMSQIAVRQVYIFKGSKTPKWVFDR